MTSCRRTRRIWYAGLSAPVWTVTRAVSRFPLAVRRPATPQRRASACRGVVSLDGGGGGAGPTFLRLVGRWYTTEMLYPFWLQQQLNRLFTSYVHTRLPQITGGIGLGGRCLVGAVHVERPGTEGSLLGSVDRKELEQGRSRAAAASWAAPGSGKPSVCPHGPSRVVTLGNAAPSS